MHNKCAANVSHKLLYDPHSCTAIVVVTYVKAGCLQGCPRPVFVEKLLLEQWADHSYFLQWTLRFSEKQTENCSLYHYFSQHALFSIKFSLIFLMANLFSLWHGDYKTCFHIRTTCFQASTHGTGARGVHWRHIPKLVKWSAFLAYVPLCDCSDTIHAHVHTYAHQYIYLQT